MKILFIGTVDFSYHVLRKLIDLEANIVGVITKEESRFNSDYCDLAPICRRNSIDYKYVKNINRKANIKWVQDRNPDVIFCFGWSQILKADLLNIAPLGIIGYHPAKLPHNRGRHPLIWALCLGLKETASTFFFMDEGADTGDILSQELVIIDVSDDAQSLYNEIVSVAMVQLEDFVLALESGNYKRISQDKSTGNIWRKRGTEDGKIDWRMNAKNIHNLVRGLTRPYVGAHFEYDDKDIIVWKTTISDEGDDNIEPGKVIDLKNGLPQVKCGAGSILLEEIEPLIEINKGEYL